MYVHTALLEQLCGRCTSKGSSKIPHQHCHPHSIAPFPYSCQVVCAQISPRGTQHTMLKPSTFLCCAQPQHRLSNPPLFNVSFRRSLRQSSFKSTTSRMRCLSRRTVRYRNSETPKAKREFALSTSATIGVSSTVRRSLSMSIPLLSANPREFQTSRPLFWLWTYLPSLTTICKTGSPHCKLWWRAKTVLWGHQVDGHIVSVPSAFWK